jgi:hypothetical protein
MGAAMMLCLLGIGSGCTTTAAKRALDKPHAKEKFAGFDAENAEKNKREAVRSEKLNPEEDPALAVPKLIAQLQKDKTQAIYAEEHLKYWAGKQGGARLVVSQTRMLLKHSDIEVRAPALRLTTLFGGDEINGDLIECLADQEYGLRASAFKALKARTGKDHGFDPSGGDATRKTAIESWRQWWQTEQKRLAVRDPSVYEIKRISEPHTQRTGDADAEVEPDEESEAKETKAQAKGSSKKSEKPVEKNKENRKEKEKKPAPKTDSEEEDSEDADPVESRLLLKGKNK